ncbi:MAG: ABC transporter permease [Candidatus Parvarchaeota archaeon]|jgi:ABC-2 type transport system permease protein|nr:ABC transporter permease [Candidatus Parvarchaeota archaeon]MCL5106673.1 ABC transporter permease [Candidatus Parvarchaeota archaeon]
MNNSIHSRDIGRFNEIAVSFKYQLKSYLRTRRFLALAILVALISIAVFAVEAHVGINAINAEYSNASNYLYSFMQNITFVVVIVAAFFGGNAISTDFASNYSYYILVQPARRSSILIGRYLAALLASFSIILIYYLFAAISSLYFFSSLPEVFASSIGLVALFVLSILSFAFFLSSLFNNPQTSTVAVVILLIVALPIVSSILQGFLSIEPWFLVNYGGQVVYSVFSTHFVHFSQSKIPTGHAAFTISQYEPYTLEGIEIMLGYIVIFFIASVFMYRYKEVKG